MRLITAANARFKDMVTDWIAKVTTLGYAYQVYDLGGLNIGTPMTEVDANFHSLGYYREFENGWKSRSIFKPKVVGEAIRTFKEQIIWLDADAMLEKPFGDLSGNYDIGVADRNKAERQLVKNFMSSGQWPDAMLRGFHNAGFIIFNPTPAAGAFVEKWKTYTDAYHNDQLALNKLLSEGKHFTVKRFSTEYNDKELTGRTIVHHMTGREGQPVKKVSPAPNR
jgi:hypothetical protein